MTRQQRNYGAVVRRLMDAFAYQEISYIDFTAGLLKAKRLLDSSKRTAS